MLIEQVFERDIAKIMEVEEAAFISPIRTTETNIKRRLGLNHVYFAAFDGTRPIGTIAFRNAHFSPHNYASFPKTFAEYAEEQNDARANAVFVYSLGVVPAHRSGFAAKKLIQAALAEAKRRGLRYCVGDSRCPSFNGSTDWPEERFKQNKELHQLIEQHLNGGSFPKNEVLLQDPVLGFYMKVMGFKALWIVPGFWMGDKPCGNFMVIIYAEL